MCESGLGQQFATTLKLRVMKRFAPYCVCAGVVVVLVTYFILMQPEPPPPDTHSQPVFSLEWAGAKGEESHPGLPTLYIITPTYKRPEQIPELTRLSQTLMHVPKLHWLVADDATQLNQDVVDYLKHTGLPFTYMLTPMPERFKRQWFGMLPKGVANRNGAIAWLRKHASGGVLYMADDDNTYDLRIFKEMRHTRKVSMFPVGLVTKTGLSSPVLQNGRWVDWFDGWIVDRTFPVDMAGFAVSVPFLLSVPDAGMPYIPGYEETGFLNSLHVTVNDIEFLASNCTKIYVWHTRTEKNHPSTRDILDKKYDGTNLRQLQKGMIIK